MPIFHFNLGDQVKDAITGMVGIIIGRTEWFNGCIRYLVQPEGMKDLMPVEGCNFDEEQLILVEAGKVAPQVRMELPGNTDKEEKKYFASNKKLKKGGPKSGEAIVNQRR
jgi:hypothetical protein